MIRHFPMKIYIAGPMTGLIDFNRPAFAQAEKALTAEGFHALNPAKNNGKDWNDFMRQALNLISSADGVYFLKGWKESKGASLEHKIALDLGLVIRYESDVFVPKSEGQVGWQEAKAQGEKLLMSVDNINEDLKRVLEFVYTVPLEIDKQTALAAARLRDLTRR